MAFVASPMYSSHPHSFFAQPQDTATTFTLSQIQPEQQQQHDQGVPEEQFSTLFCRALYDYEAQDASALSFCRGDIIEVLNQQPSGWWDGLLADERGWFPSNYVELISDEEADMAFAALESAAIEGTVSENDPIILEMTPASARGMTQAENEEWLASELSYRNEGVMPPNVGHSTPSSDFWMPQVTTDGQIYYVNTQTGQLSRDLPQEADDQISDTELPGFASQSSSLSGTSVGLVLGPEASNNGQGIAGFGIPRHTGTPEPWVRKLADDGMSYYYLNKTDGKVQLIRPQAPRQTLPPPMAKSSSQSSLQSSFSSTSQPRLPHRRNRHSIYSDDSDVQPLDALPSPRNAGETASSRERGQKPPSIETVAPDHTSAERIARSLQEALAPDPPEVVPQLSAIAKSAIDAVVNNIRLRGLARRPEDDRRMDELINNVVLAVRNLLYISAVPTGQIPVDALPRGAREPSAPASQSPLKPAQRKVTATLSRLVLSARAMQYDAGSLIADTLHRIEVDAEELEKAVFSFALHAQRTRDPALQEAKSLKRLYGVFGTSNIGLGLVGGGVAGRWKGFGWVAVSEPRSSSRRMLGPEVISELKLYLADLDEQFQFLIQTMQTADQSSVEQVRIFGKELVSQVSSLLVFVADIHVARHVDIDGYRQEGSPSNELYSRAVENARLLVRTLETVVQSAFNDCATFFITLQAVRDSELSQYREERSSTYEHLDALCSSLSADLTLLLHTLDSLLSLGHDQADMAQGDYNGSIEWRMSLISIVPISNFAMDERENPDVVDIELAFGRQDTKTKAGEVYYPPYSDQSHANESDATHTLRSSDDFRSTEETFLADDVPQSSAYPPRPHDPNGVIDDPSPRSPSRPGGSSKLEKSKLEKILGAEYADKVAADVAADLQPWYLRTAYNSQEILVDNDGSIRGGTVAALVERLTAHEQADRPFINAFLMTFKSFTTLDELFDLLVARFRIQPPAQLTVTEREEWGKLKQHVIQMRVINTFKSMITDDDVLEKEDLYILDRIKAFALSDEMSQFAAAKALVSHIDRVKGGDNPKIPYSKVAPPTPILPKANKKLKLADIDPVELARQLTIMESQLYQKIKPMECLQRAREQRMDNIDNITTVIQTSNRIADWVADSVLSRDDARKRAVTVKQLITIADRCRVMNNFSTMIAITSGLNTPPIRRLKRTWDQVNQRVMAQFTSCEMMIDSNKTFTKYRQLMSSVTPPCVPFIGVFLSTLQFIQDGNPDNLPGGLVNFRKRQKAFEVINDIKHWQAHRYNFQVVPAIQSYIEESLNQFNDTRASSDHFWALSLEKEPKEREDEKMTRLLQESGFL